jgi:hypothetical protein
MMLPADPLTRLATLATLSPKGGRGLIVKSYAGQDTRKGDRGGRAPAHAWRERSGFPPWPAAPVRPLQVFFFFSVASFSGFCCLNH